MPSRLFEFILFIPLLLFTQVVLGQDSQSKTSGISCDNWLKTQAPGQSVKIGDLDVSGNQITVEAVFNRTTPYTGGPLYAGDLVSKHDSPSDVNYLLRPNSAEITTTTGYHFISAPCEIEINKTYHVALVYDGSTLKFYRNGFLMNEINVQGNLFQNNYITTIGDYAYPFPDIGTNFVGLINEVRIWNVARSQDDIRAYMFSPLPSPTTQTGLLAYYTFDGLQNKQGNAAWNGILTGAASINQTNNNCEMVADSCQELYSPYIINDYTPVTGLDVCNNSIQVEDATAFNPGDTVMLVQLQGAVADTTNTANFGHVTSLNNAGVYELNLIQSINGNSITFLNSILRSYDVPNGKVQLVRVPYYTNFDVSSTLSCPRWNGKTGGILVLHVKDTLTLNADIDVSEKGFRGGVDPGINPATPACNESNYFYPANSPLASGKGEGFANLSPGKSSGKGHIANGGGAGNSFKAGGGGGGSAGVGGNGGYQFDSAPCNITVPFDNRGLSGEAGSISFVSNRISLGGGGGAGHSNNQTGFLAHGGAGGGIAIIICDVLINNSGEILSNGQNAPECGSNNAGCLVGSGGGGGGGAVYLKSNDIPLPLNVSVAGGKGGDLWAGSMGKAGPGGGGGGGLLCVNNPVTPPNISINNNGGANGVCRNYANNAWGASAGSPGNVGFNWVIPQSNTPFVKNIDSIVIAQVSGTCSSFQFNAIGYTQHTPINTWTWDFGDQTTGNQASETHTYDADGTYTVTLYGEDPQGCRDTTNTTVTTTSVQIEMGADTTICSNNSAQITLHASTNATTYSWASSTPLNDINSLTPIAIVSSNSTFYFQATNGSCSGIDSVHVFINPLPTVQTIPDTAICAGSALTLTSISNASQVSWNSGAPVSDTQILNPEFTGISSSQLILTAIASTGCEAKDTLNITVNPNPDVQTIADTSICGQGTVFLTSTGALSYSWLPPANLSDPNIASPQFTGSYPVDEVYHVLGTDANGCEGMDSVHIMVNEVPYVTTIPDTSICDGSTLNLTSASDASQFTWLPAGAVSNPNVLSPAFVSHQTETLSLVGINPSTGCKDTATVEIQVTAKPLVQTINDFTTCTDGPFVLTTTATGAVSYQWQPTTNLNNPLISSPVFTPPSAGNYTFYVSGFSAEGCEGKDTVTISTGDKPVFHAPQQPLPQCAGIAVQLNAFNGDGYTYLWTPSAGLDNPNIYNPFASPPAATTYTVKVHDDYCEYDSVFTVILNVLPSPTVQATKSNDIDCSHPFATLTAGGAANYSWAPAGNLSNSNSANPTATPASTTSYVVTGYNTVGCSAKDTITIKVKGGQYFNFNIPNSFTPNGDNLNDCFGVRYWGQPSNFHLTVFNRYGEKVFESFSKDNCWDGTYKGKRALAGNYVFHLTAETPCGNVEKKGNVLLIR